MIIKNLTSDHIRKSYVDQEDIDRSIAEHESRVTKSGIIAVLVHDLIFIAIIYFFIKCI